MRAFQLRPEDGGTVEQVLVGVVVVEVAVKAGLSVVRALVVRRGMRVNEQGAQAAAAGIVATGCPHAAAADDDEVVGFHGYPMGRRRQGLFVRVGVGFVAVADTYRCAVQFEVFAEEFAQIGGVARRDVRGARAVDDDVRRVAPALVRVLQFDAVALH